MITPHRKSRQEEMHMLKQWRQLQLLPKIATMWECQVINMKALWAKPLSKPLALKLAMLATYHPPQIQTGLQQMITLRRLMNLSTPVLRSKKTGKFLLLLRCHAKLFLS